MSDQFAQLEAKIFAELDRRLTEATASRDALPERGFDPKFWNDSPNWFNIAAGAPGNRRLDCADGDLGGIR